MITSKYIVITYITGDHVLICKYCYYLYIRKLYYNNFLCRCKGYVIPKDIIICFMQYILYNIVK